MSYCTWASATIPVIIRPPHMPRMPATPKVRRPQRSRSRGASAGYPCALHFDDLTTAAYMARAAMRDRQVAEVISEGEDAAVQYIAEYAYYARALLNWANQNDFYGRGVFHYEVSEPFGDWFTSVTINRGHMPTWADGHDKLMSLMAYWLSNNDCADDSEYNYEDYLNMMYDV